LQSAAAAVPAGTASHPAAAAAACPPHSTIPFPPPTQGYLSISFNDTYYQLAATPGRNTGVPPLTPAQQAALQAFREVADQVKLDFWLQPGDLQVVHNQTQVHNRSAYEDHDVSKAGKLSAKGLSKGCTTVVRAA
jgi:hypothetical protein